MIDADARGARTTTVLPNGAMTPLFWAVADATEESVLNSLVAARTTTGRNGHVSEAIDVDELRRFVERRGR